MDRRQFLKLSSSLIIAQNIHADRLLASPKNNKSIVWEAIGISIENITAIFQSLGGIEQYIKKELPRAVVVIKPNLCLPHAEERGTTTSIRVIELICQYLLSKGVGRIIIADHTLQNVDSFKESSLFDLKKKSKAIKIILADKERYYVPIKVEGTELKETEILKLLSKADLFINLATAKHHSATDVSLCIKNLMGAIWDRTKFHTKLDLHQSIADLALVLKPQINIIDASRVLIKGGPAGPGPVSKDNRLFASKDILAVDSVVSSRYNFGGRTLFADDIQHLVASYENGIGEIDLKKIDVKVIKS